MAAGIAEGAVLRCGGARPDDPTLADGFYYPPTVLDGCRSGMRVVREESVRPGADGRALLRADRAAAEDAAVAWPTTPTTGWPGRSGPPTRGRAERVARRLRMGTV